MRAEVLREEVLVDDGLEDVVGVALGEPDALRLVVGEQGADEPDQGGRDLRLDDGVRQEFVDLLHNSV